MSARLRFQSRGFILAGRLPLQVRPSPSLQPSPFPRTRPPYIEYAQALFYKTQNGADVGDIFMSLIYTAELNGESPFDYLVALQRHHEAAAAAPAEWMPWSYREAAARLGQAAQPAAPDTDAP